MYVSEPPPPVPWVAYPSIAAKGHLTLLSAQPKVGKTWVSLAIATALSGQRKIAGMSNGGNPHRVIYLDAENGEGVLRRRIYALKSNPELLEIYDARGFSLSDIKSLTALLKNSWNEPSLIVFDSFTTLWGGNQMDPGEITQVLDGIRNWLQKWDCAGLLIHHDSRYGGAYRGSGAIAACCEIILQLGTTNSCFYERELSWGGCRVDETPNTYRFNLREITGNGTACDCECCASYRQGDF